MKTYLYIKTHNVTGLKYFGKTFNNPFVYRGSGIRWLNHIRKHGYDVSTEIIFVSEDINELSSFAIEFSLNNKIVESEEWANLTIETGKDGGPIGPYKPKPPISDKTRKKLSEWQKGKKLSDEHKRKISKTLSGRTSNRKDKKKFRKT